jgi:hemerythrin-like domain-containing protein
METQTNRRGFLVTSGMGLGLVAASCAGAKPTRTAAPAQPGHEEEEVSPAEDLMREHGVLERILLIYEEGLRRLDAGSSPSEVITRSARIVRRFVEDYHEKLEEEHLFPRLEQAGALVELVSALRAQHQAGRRLTDEIVAAASGSTPRALAGPIRGFIRMYRPHAAREDTVLFPAFKEVLPEGEYRELGERFEEREHELFGAAGFRGIVDEVASLEKTIGIYELAQFTP